MNLIINNHIIDSDLFTILNDIRNITDGKFLKDIIKRGDNVGVTCPFHKNGQENHPSCYIYYRKDNENVPYGFFKCFTCGTQGNLYVLVSQCLNITIEDAKQWLVDNYSSALTYKEGIELPEIDLNKQHKTYLDESILNKYAYFHPYMSKRKVSNDILFKFKVGWNPDSNSITFPVWDEHGGLVGITERNVDNKYFKIPEGLGKPVYLLNFIIKENINEVFVCESQIDALYCWSLGIPAIALLGTGSKEQYRILKKSGIRTFHLALDGDMAGRHGIMRFIKSMPEDVFIDILLMPEGKDINDLSKDEIKNITRVDKNNYLQDTNIML